MTDQIFAVRFGGDWLIARKAHVSEYGRLPECGPNDEVWCGMPSTAYHGPMGSEDDFVELPSTKKEG